MAETKQNVTILLDRLYNLKGEDNVLIRENEEKIEAALERIANIEATIAGAKEELANQEQGLSTFLQQKSLFETAFEGITDETFSALSRIDVNLEIGTLLSQVQERSPEFIQNLMATIEGIKNDIIRYEGELEEANNELANLRNELVQHNNERAQLVSLLEQCLSAEEVERESLTTNFVKKVLASFGVFTTDEVSKLTKMIIFPEDGLYEYDRGYEERVAKGLIGYVEDETPLVDVALDETPAVEETVADEEMSLGETGGIPSVLGEDGQIKLDLSKIGTLGEDEPPVVEDEEVVIVPPVVGDVEDEKVVSTPAAVESPVEEKKVELEGPPVVLNFQQFQEEDIDKVIAGEKKLDEVTPLPVVEIVEETVVEEEPAIVDEEEPEVVETPTTIVEEEPAPEVSQPVEEFDSTQVEAFLDRIGLDVNNFSKVNTESTTTILKRIAATEEEVVERNYEILRSINLDDEAYKMRLGHMFITDADFSKKITLLRAKNISETKIQSMIKDTNSGLRVSFEDMEKRIQSL